MERRKLSGNGNGNGTDSDLPTYKPYVAPFSERPKQKIVPAEEPEDKPVESKVVALDKRKERKFTAEELGTMFVKHKGHLAKVASELQCSRQTLYRAIKDNEDLKFLLVELREEKLDSAEEQLQALVEKKNLTAIIFTLKCLGAHRGWIDRDVASGSDGKGSHVVINILPANGSEGKVITTEIKPELNRKFVDKDTPALVKALVEGEDG